MARKPVVIDNDSHATPAADLSGLPAMVEAANQLAVMEAQRDTTVRAVAATLGYQLPADCTDPDLIQRDIAANMRRSVEACLEVGRGLRVLKEACEHGQFVARLDVLGLDRSVAVRFMQAATKFSNVASTHHLTDAIGSQTKLFEMLVLDDEQIEELELTGQTGELTLDDVATMSVKELRAALRELRCDLDAKDAVLDKTQQKLTGLQVQLKKKIVADTDWPDALIPITDQVAAAGRKIATGISELETCRITLFEVAQTLPEDQRPKYEAALAHVAEAYEQALSQAERNVQKERVTYDKTLGAYQAE
ncbi:hypothetical protein [Azonexus sp.]|jgi:hypothetical protein|uniref:hypothetical protein n=1 Tax=Azonexus sp. TaxID=1872668 RepID=UPI002830A740|nr:hypothetical protein [Azonexus sp.]MDR1995133.1 hypothetical protein [Azonexus sp.]